MSRSDDPRAAYIAIATTQFAAHGFHGVSLAALAHEAGVTKQALLHFFGTKERLYGDVLSALAGRLCAQFDADGARAPDPAAHLARHFQQIQQRARTDPGDAQLVIRALLDSAAPNGPQTGAKTDAQTGAQTGARTARHWPLQAYLDRLTHTVQATPGGAALSQAAALAGVYQIIGALQYHAVSGPTLAGMFGARTRADMDTAMHDFVQVSLARLCNPAP